ncbi:MAG TPA: hypothetical protein VHV47_02520 [Opitutaceae bacterium]|jgi:hypothetical protein|nr:hypothetical protein [Opitutaceae bacterium]
MAEQTVLKTLRIPQSLADSLALKARAERKDFSTVARECLARGLADQGGIDMSLALSDAIGKFSGTGESQAEVMKRFGQSRHH